MGRSCGGTNSDQGASRQLLRHSGHWCCQGASSPQVLRHPPLRCMAGWLWKRSHGFNHDVGSIRHAGSPSWLQPHRQVSLAGSTTVSVSLTWVLHL